MSIDIASNTPLRAVPEDYAPPGAERWFTIPDGLDAGKQLFYYDHVIGDGTPEATVLFVHGNPECSYTYRFVRDALITEGAPLRLVAPDHIGFGISDQADFEMVDMHHAANLMQLVRHLDLRNIVLVVHDWGGPIGVGALAEEPERVRGLVVLNSTIFPMPPDGATYANWPWRFLPWCRTPHVVPDRAWGGIAGCVLAHGNPGPLVGLYGRMLTYQARFALGVPASDPATRVFSEALRSRANARSSKRNVLQTPYWGHGYSYDDPRHGRQDNHAFYRRMQQTVPAAWGPTGAAIPAAGIFGAWDPCAKESVIQQWHEALPQMVARTTVHPDIGHFVEEHKGPEIARAVMAVADAKA